MRALFVGLGSIGQRHLNNFKNIVGNLAEIIVYRETNHNALIKDGKQIPCESLEIFYGFQQVDSFHDGLNKQPDIVFITNPSSKHLEFAIKAARHGCNLFIEKPLSHNLDGIDLLSELVYDKKIIVGVGYQTRFHPCFSFVNNLLSDRKNKQIISASFKWGTFLPSHHPYEDYKVGYAANKILGGGVVLGLSHEIDIICNLWGQPDKLFAVNRKPSSLGINAEDTVHTLMEYSHNNVIFPVSLFLSYSQVREERKFKIQFEDALIFCDLVQNKVELFNDSGNLVVQKIFPALERNDLFLEEMRAYLDAVQQKKQFLIPLSDGIETLKLAMRIKELINE